MRILIISLPRTGSTSLMSKLSSQYNLKELEEPFNIRNRKKLTKVDINGNDIVLKTIIDQIPPKQTDYLTYWYNTSKTFDKIILLSRRDLKACAESLAFLDYNEKKGFRYNEKYKWYWTENYDSKYEYLIKRNEELITLSEMLKIDITYYEDIYDINSSDRLRTDDLKPNKLL